MYDKIVCITNRKLCKSDFLQQIELVASSGVDRIILREKDLPEDEYLELAKKVINICEKSGTECVLHYFINVANKLNYNKIHLPLSILKENSNTLSNFSLIGASTHSLEQAKDAISFGATYITTGHIFTTDCKKGLPPRGLNFLSSICQSTDLPIYAIGGINGENAHLALEQGAHGVCLMSQFMVSDNPAKIVKEIRQY